jgi:hypothetical protein
MSDYLESLLKRRIPGASDIEQDEPKTRDADGKQLVQPKNALRSDFASWQDIPLRPDADLDLTSTERRRAARSRTLRKR